MIPEEPLLEDGVPAGLSDDQICYLLDHDGNKEGCVACPFQVFPLVPRLSIGRRGDSEIWGEKLQRQSGKLWEAFISTSAGTRDFCPEPGQ